MSKPSRKLKFWCPIWKDPLSWARWVGNTKINMILFLLFHIEYVLFILYIGKRFVQSVDEAIMIMVGFLVFIAVIFPGYYIYVIYRLIKMIDERNKGDTV